MPFDRPTLLELIDRAAGDFETHLPGTDARLRRSNLNVLGRVHSGAAHGLYGFLDWQAKQILPDTAEAEILERHASIWGIGRKAAVRANGNVTFTGADNVNIPAATEIQRADGVKFTTDAAAVIAVGSALVPVTAKAPGVDGNSVAASGLTLVSPIAGVDSPVTVDVAGLTAGADVEDDPELRTRVLARIQQPPHGGADFDYEQWALEVAGVTRAWVYPLELGLGTVTVRFVRDDDVAIIPDAAEVQAVQDYIDPLRPVTADVTVVAPIAVAMDFTISSLNPSTQVTKDAIEASLEDLFRREAQPEGGNSEGTILISHIREAISIASGEYDHVLDTPVSNVTHNVGEMAVMGVVTWA